MVVSCEVVTKLIADGKGVAIWVTLAEQSQHTNPGGIIGNFLDSSHRLSRIDLRLHWRLSLIGFSCVMWLRRRGLQTQSVEVKLIHQTGEPIVY